MKKEISLFILILFIIPTILAVNIDLSKQSYDPQETLQAEITGNFISLTNANILIYKKDAVHSTPVISDLTKQSGVYYFYAILPNQEANYSIKIEGAQYIESGQTKTDTITQEFTIKKTNNSILQINPGFVKTSEDFSIKITSLNNNQDVSAELESTGEIQSFSIIQDIEKTASFTIPTTTGKTNLKINDYNIPVFVIGTSQEPETEKNQTSNETTEPEPKISEQELENLTEQEIQALHCSDFGRQCEDNEKCSGQTKTSLEGPCCVGECEEKKDRNYGWMFGILIVAVLIIIFILILKIKKRTRSKSTEEILADKAKKFTKRMGKQVTGNVSKS